MNSPNSLRVHRLAGLLLVLAAFALIVSPGYAQNNIAEAQRQQQQGRAAYQAGDYSGFAEAMEKALELNPSSYATRYNLACGYARTGRAEEALALLHELAVARVDFGMAEDPDLVALRGMPAFQRLIEDLERTLVPVANSTRVFTLDQLGLLPEGFAIDEATDRMFISTMRRGDIYVVEGEEQLSKFATVEHDGPLAAVGLEVDAERGLLWAVGTSFFMSEGFDAEAPVRAGVFGFDLSSGELQRKHLLLEVETGFNDLTVAPTGEIFVSGGRLSRVAADGGDPEPLELEPLIPGTNGITLAPDGKTLFVAVYPVGLARVDLESRRWQYLDEPEDSPLIGIDGLYWYEGDLVGIQNGLQPWRLLRMELNDDGTAVKKVHVLEFANRELTATTGAIRDGEIYYLGQTPGPEKTPSQFPESLAQFLGKPVVMRAPLE